MMPDLHGEQRRLSEEETPSFDSEPADVGKPCSGQLSDQGQAETRRPTIQHHQDAGQPRLSVGTEQRARSSGHDAACTARKDTERH